jgi:Toprim-like
MSIIKIRGQSVDVDVRGELEQFNWTRPTWSGDKLIAASPFRYDNTPSFFVRLEQYGDYPAGTWADSGYYDEEWASGNFVKLFAFLRNETYEETEEYLLGEYGRFDSGEQITLVAPNLKLRTQPNYLPQTLLASYSDDYAYLKSRGISEEVQRSADIRYDSKSRTVILPWYDANKRLCNVKFRTVYGKTFWYAKGAVPIRELVYGIESVEGPVSVLEEAEIDALSWRTVGVQAIAVGGASFTDKQADIIKRSAVRTLYISGDNDKAGRKFTEQVASKLRGYVELRRIAKPEQYKDTNEALMAGENIQNFLEKSVNVDKFCVSITNITI